MYKKLEKSSLSLKKLNNNNNVEDLWSSYYVPNTTLCTWPDLSNLILPAALGSGYYKHRLILRRKSHGFERLNNLAKAMQL